MVSQTYTLMLVEDDQALRSGLRELFEREGYRVVAASCVQEARNLFFAHINLIVLDVTLPDGNGVALCREWRNQSVTRLSFSSPPKTKSLMSCAAWMPVATLM